MHYLRNVVSLKMVMVTVVALYLLMAISSAAYMGTRYGKREMARLGQRSLISRGARFYPGPRYAGKRSYWQPSAYTSEDAEIGSDSGNLPSSPYDCIYVPFVGVRCTRPDEANYWSNDEEVANGSGGSPSSSSGGSSVVTDQA